MGCRTGCRGLSFCFSQGIQISVMRFAWCPSFFQLKNKSRSTSCHVCQAHGIAPRRQEHHPAHSAQPGLRTAPAVGAITKAAVKQAHCTTCVINELFSCSAKAMGPFRRFGKCGPAAPANLEPIAFTDHAHAAKRRCLQSTSWANPLEALSDRPFCQAQKPLSRPS